jgi:hypothetical protein
VLKAPVVPLAIRENMMGVSALAAVPQLRVLPPAQELSYLQSVLKVRATQCAYPDDEEW